MDMDVDIDDAVPFSQGDWTNGEEEDMEWDAAVLEAALHELDHLRHGRVPEASDATPRPTHERSLLDTNDAGLSHADGGVMSTTHETGQSSGPRVVTIVPDTNVLVHEGGASLDRLLGRFRARIGAEFTLARDPHDDNAGEYAQHELRDNHCGEIAEAVPGLVTQNHAIDEVADDSRQEDYEGVNDTLHQRERHHVAVCDVRDLVRKDSLDLLL